MTNVTAIAAAGLKSAMRDFSGAAANIVAGGLPSAPAASPIVSRSLPAPVSLAGDLPAAMVDALQAVNAYRANLVMFQAGAQMFKSLLDVVA